jgi:hypothetical protein
VQAVPLRVDAAGGAALPVWLAWQPMVMLAPGATRALYAAFTAPGYGVYVAPPPPVTLWPVGSVKPSRRPPTAVVPVLVIATEAVRPVFLALVPTVTLQGRTRSAKDVD